jgi:hypothetical protein
MNWRRDFYFYKNKHKGKYLRERRSHPTKALFISTSALDCHNNRRNTSYMDLTILFSVLCIICVSALLSILYKVKGMLCVEVMSAHLPLCVT